ncbi:MAG: M48 family metallopeptidase [Lentisphaerae bacterium]|nr:M48 family metallopeptidase [Lentisphaerota bacterium]
MPKRIYALAAARFLGAGLLASLLVSCTTVPETGRRGLMLITPEQELQLGISEFRKLKQSTPICTDAKTNEMVQRVGRRISAVAPLANARWEFVVFDDNKTVNAFCLPGGKVGIYTGIMRITQDEAGLATVIGHEVSHAVARHGAERLSQGLLAEFGGEILGQVINTNSEDTRELWLQVYGLAGAVGVLLPYSRLQESEADYLGLLYMARAGYDPRQAIEFWKRMAAHGSKQGGNFLAGVFQFLSTHPLDEARIKQLQEQLPKALAEYQPAIANEPTGGESP